MGKKVLVFGIILVFVGLTFSPALSASFSKNTPIFETINLIINDDGSGDPTDGEVDIPSYVPDSGITPTIIINFTITGTNSTESTAFYGDDPWEDWKNISITGDTLNPVNSTTLYHVGNTGDWNCAITPTKPGGTIILDIDWPGNGSATEDIQIVNGTFVLPAVDFFVWGLDVKVVVTILDIDGAPVKNANVYLIWEEDDYEFNHTSGTNQQGNGMNGEYWFWILQQDQGDLQKNITIAAQWYGGFWGYAKITSTPAAKDIVFDIAYINDIYAELPAGGGITFMGASFGLIINTGPETITYQDLKAAKITVSSDVEGASLSIGFNIYENTFPPIEPKHAWGSVDNQNHFLVDLLNDDEELMNMTPQQTFYFMVDRQYYTGIAHFHISLQIGNRISYFETTITYVAAPEHYAELLSGERVKSNLFYTDTAVASFGPITPILNLSSIRLIDGDPAQIQKIQSLMKSRILQFITPIVQFNLTHLDFSVTYPREIPQKYFFQRFLFMTWIQKDNTSRMNVPHEIIVNDFNGVFMMVRGAFFQMNPPRFTFAGMCSGVTLIDRV
jgi:hypothetical protein